MHYDANMYIRTPCRQQRCLLVDFRDATDRITSLCVTLDDVAEAVGRAGITVRQARLSPDASGYRNPPPGWPEALARLARERAAALVTLADELDEAHGP